MRWWGLCLPIGPGLGVNVASDSANVQAAVRGETSASVKLPMKKKKHSRQPPLAPQDIQDLAHVLRKEHLFIQAERQQIQQLNVKVN